jgi:hypothetical protein
LGVTLTKEEPKSRRRQESKRKKTSQQELQERYEVGDPEVDLLGEPLEKFDSYVIYSKSKPSPTTTSFVMLKPSCSDTLESDPMALDDDS